MTQRFILIFYMLNIKFELYNLLNKKIRYIFIESLGLALKCVEKQQEDKNKRRKVMFE